MLALSCLAMACCLLAYITIMKRAGEKRKQKIQRLQKHLRNLNKKQYRAGESTDNESTKEDTR